MNLTLSYYLATYPEKIMPSGLHAPVSLAYQTKFPQHWTMSSRRMTMNLGPDSEKGFKTQVMKKRNHGFCGKGVYWVAEAWNIA